MTFGLETQVTHDALAECQVVECRAEDIASVAEDAADLSRDMVMVDSLGIHRERSSTDGASVILVGEHGHDIIPGHAVAAPDVIPATSLSVVSFDSPLPGFTHAETAPGVMPEGASGLLMEVVETPDGAALGAISLDAHRASVPPADSKPFTYGELFAGVSGFGLGFERAGAKCAWRCEIDRQAQDVLRFNYPSDPLWGDVTTFDPEAFAVPDAVLFGSPCQDLSVAGKRAGLEGSRSGLFHEAIRIIRSYAERGMRWAVWENVPGALSSNNGRDFAEILASFLDAGALDVGWAVLDSQWFGVPQRRRRVFVVADFRGRCAGEILALAQGLRGDTPPSRETGQGVAASLTAGSHGSSNAPGRRREDDVNLVPDVAGTLGSGGEGTRGWANDLDRSGAFIPSLSKTLLAKGNSSHDVTLETYVQTFAIQERAVSENPDAGPQGKGWQEDIAYTLEARHHVQATAHTLRADGFDASEDGAGRGTPIIPFDPHQVTSKANGSKCEPGSPNGSLHGRGTMAVAFDWQKGDGGSDDSFRGKSRSWIARAGDYTGALGATKRDAVSTGMSVRRLTPRECERLQGFGDDMTRYGLRGNGTVYEMADGPRYKMCGNAVTSNVAEWIGRNLLAVAA